MKARTVLAAAVLICLGFAVGIIAERTWMTGSPQNSQMEHGMQQESAEAGDATAGGGEQAPEHWYTCGMHPEVIQDHPGDCPKCGMKLQPMAADRAEAMGLATASSAGKSKPKGERKIIYWKSSMIPGEIHEEPGKDSMGMDLVPVYEDEAATSGVIQIDPVTEQNMGVRIDEVTTGPLTKRIRTVGFIDYDETTLADVNTKISGWVEKLYVEETGVQVHAGEPLFELYSPELFSAQEEYLTALRNVQKHEVGIVPRSRLDSSALIRDARTRLEYFDISEAQIKELERSGKAKKTLTINAPFTGIVTEKMVVEGRYIKAGMDVFRIADLSNVWMIAKVFEYDLPHVSLGQEAFMQLSYIPGKTFRGRVTYIYPYLESKTREIPIRIEFHNPGYELKPGMYATVSLRSKLKDKATLVPDVAVINTGLRSVAFVMKEPGRFQPREITTGVRAEGNRLEVLSGLAPGEKVVVSGQFLLDSESNLREAALKFLKPGKADGAEPIKTATKAAGHKISHETHGDLPLRYVCPMPEHADILYDNPGKCPICSMELVPIRSDSTATVEPSYWVCPMPEHESIHEKNPGKCSICGMTLIPAKSESE